MRVTALALALLLTMFGAAQQPASTSRTDKKDDWSLVKGLLECRSKYQQTLEQLRAASAP